MAALDIFAIAAKLGSFDPAKIEKEIREGCRDTRDGLARVEALLRRQVDLLEIIAANTKEARYE